MADEATCFSLTTTEMAAGNVTSQHSGDEVDVTTKDAGSMTASVDVGLYYLKAAYEGADGRSKLLRHLEKLVAKIHKSAWPPI